MSDVSRATLEAMFAMRVRERPSSLEVDSTPISELNSRNESRARFLVRRFEMFEIATKFARRSECHSCLNTPM